MMPELTNQATLDFIHQHQDEDVRRLAFLGSKSPGVDLPYALDQIRGRQTAKDKLPRWAATNGIVYPPHISMEQCSSEQTALYKAHLAERLLRGQKGEDASESAATGDGEGTSASALPADASFVDLTGGFGVDFSYITARLGARSVYVERQAHLCEAARHNFSLLGLEKAVVVNGDGVEVLHALRPLKLIFIDPARRNDAGRKMVSLHDCTPDVTLLQDEMLAKARFVMVKLSPMLDWHRAVSEMKGVREIHIVSKANECKELLLVLSADASAEDSAAGAPEKKGIAENLPQLYCVNDGQTVACSLQEMEQARVHIAPMQTDAMRWLYEPNASLMKAGCFALLSERYGVEMLASNSHLFVSATPVADFPGRRFAIEAVSTLNKKEVKRCLAAVTHANIATRNFPLSVAELRKRLKLKDGGSTYLFASTLSDGTHVLFKCGGGKSKS